MAKRKAVMWALWYEGESCPVEVHRTRDLARERGGGIWSLRIVRVEIRPLHEKRKSRRKVKRG